MKFRSLLFSMLAIAAAIFMHDVLMPAINTAVDLVSHNTSGVAVLASVVSLTGLRNISEQIPNPPGVRRLFAILVADLQHDVVDWPRYSDIDQADHTLTTPIPVQAGKTLSIITPADNSCELVTENQGDRYYMAFKQGLVFDIAGNEPGQVVEANKFLNAGAIFIIELPNDKMRVVGTKLNPIVLKVKGQTGKKGGDKNGMTFSGDNDSYMFQPPFYPATEALPLPADEA